MTAVLPASGKSGDDTGWVRFKLPIVADPGQIQGAVDTANEAAMRLLIEAQIAAMRADDWPGAFALASPDLQAQYGTPDALKDDVTAHCAPLPAIASAEFIDIVTFRGLPTYRVTLADGNGLTTTAYYLVRRLDDGSLRIAGCVLVRVPSS